LAISHLDIPPTGIMRRWALLFRGLTWKTVAVVFLINMTIAGLQSWQCWDCGDARYGIFIFGHRRLCADALYAANWQTDRLRAGW
jgi:hypothetical protein